MTSHFIGFLFTSQVWWRRETTLIQAKKKKRKWYPKKGKCSKAYLAQTGLTVFDCLHSETFSVIDPPLSTPIDWAACTYRYLGMCCTFEAALYHTWFLFSSLGNYGYAHSFCNCNRVKISHSKIDRHTRAHTIQLPILIWLEKHVVKVPRGLTISGRDICIWQESHQTGLILQQMEG